MDMKTWAKTPEGQAAILGQKDIVCVDGQLYQGYNQLPVEVHDDQLTEAELDEVIDVDGTLSRVHFRLQQRLQSRDNRKQEEYDTRRSVLRARRREIMGEVKEARELGLPPSPDIESELGRIDARLKRLADEGLRLRLARANDRLVPQAEKIERAVEEAKAAAQPVECPHCQTLSPDGHKNPKMWLRGHRMACKARVAEKASA